MGEEVRFVHNVASRVKSITDDEAVGDGALRGEKGAYGLEGEGKEKQTFLFLERRQRMKREFTLGFSFGGFFFRPC